MPELKVRCPNCKKTLQLKVAAQHSAFKARCPECQSEFKVTVPSASTPATPAAKVPQNDPFADLNDPALLPPSQQSVRPSPGRFAAAPSPSHFGAAPYAGAPKAKRSTGGQAKKYWLLGAAISGSLVMIAAGVAIWYFMPAGLLTNVASSTTATDSEALESSIPSLPWRPERLKDLNEELTALAEKTQAAASALPQSELATTGVKQLKDANKQFEEMFYRVLYAVPEPPEVSTTDVAAQPVQRPAGADAAPPANHIWTLGGTVNPSDPWKAATREVTESRLAAENALTSRRKYPDPLKETSGVNDWSAEDRRVLSAYWLQGELERDVATELLACLRERVSSAELENRCGAVIDRYIAPAIELAKVPSTQGKLLINVPKGTMYERHRICARYVLIVLKERHTDPAIVAIIKEAVDVSDAIEAVQFQMGGDLIDYSKTTTSERLAANRQAEQKKKAEEERLRQQKLAEEEQARQQELKLAEERAAKQAAEKEASERRIKELAEGKRRASEEQSSVPSAPTGPRFGMGGGPYGPGRGTGIPRRPDFSGAPGPPAMPAGPSVSDPREKPSAEPSSSDQDEAMVKLLIAQATKEQFQEVSQAIKAITGNYRTSMSNGKVELEIYKYTGSLSELADKLPMLKFDKLDDATRTVEASFR